MSWTAPRTWVTGEVVTAALMNTHVRDDLRYLKGLDGDVTIEDDIVIGANKIKMTSHLLKEDDPTWLAIKNAADDAYSRLKILTLGVSFSIDCITDGVYITAPNIDNNHFDFKARDNTVGRVEVARLQGAADPYFQMTLPQVLTPGTAPGTLVEGHFWYLAADDKLYYRDASANIELVGINAPTRGDMLYRAASNWLNLGKGSAGQVLTQGANDPAWSGQNVIVFSTAGLFDGTSPTSFTDLDISGTVGSNQAVCLIKVFNNSGDATNQLYKFRKDDDAADFDNLVGVSNGASTLADQEACYFIIITDATGVVEWKSNVAKTTVITMEAYLK